ncbi:unnamed protein product [Camellia sinensis]
MLTVAIELPPPTIAALATAADHRGSRHRRSPSRPPSQPHLGIEVKPGSQYTCQLDPGVKLHISQVLLTQQ